MRYSFEYFKREVDLGKFIRRILFRARYNFILTRPFTNSLLGLFCTSLNSSPSGNIKEALSNENLD